MFDRPSRKSDNHITYTTLFIFSSIHRTIAQFVFIHLSLTRQSDSVISLAFILCFKQNSCMCALKINYKSNGYICMGSVFCSTSNKGFFFKNLQNRATSSFYSTLQSSRFQQTSLHQLLSFPPGHSARESKKLNILVISWIFTLIHTIK